jgi:hypothetical protein
MTDCCALALVIQAEPLNYLALWLHLCGNGKGGKKKQIMIETFTLLGPVPFGPLKKMLNMQCSIFNAQGLS